MGTISRPGRSRHNSGRSLFRETQRKSDDIMLSPKERKTPVKEVGLDIVYHMPRDLGPPPVCPLTWAGIK